MHHGRVPPAAIGLLAGLLTTAAAVALTATGLLPPWPPRRSSSSPAGSRPAWPLPSGRRRAPCSAHGRRLRRGPALDRARRPVDTPTRRVLLSLPVRADRRGLGHALRPSQRDRRRRRRGRAARPRRPHRRRGTGPGSDARAAAVARDRRGRPPVLSARLGPRSWSRRAASPPSSWSPGSRPGSSPASSRSAGRGPGPRRPSSRRLRPRGPRALFHGAGLDARDGGRRARGALADRPRAHGRRGPPGRRARRGARREFQKAVRCVARTGVVIKREGGLRLGRLAAGLGLRRRDRDSRGTPSPAGPPRGERDAGSKWSASVGELDAVAAGDAAEVVAHPSRFASPGRPRLPGSGSGACRPGRPGSLRGRRRGAPGSGRNASPARPGTARSGDGRRGSP